MCVCVCDCDCYMYMYVCVFVDALDADVLSGLNDRNQPMQLLSGQGGVVNVAMKVSSVFLYAYSHVS